MLYVVPPSIITSPKSFTAITQSNVTFTCVAAAKPRAVIQWIRDENVLNNSSNNETVKYIIVNKSHGDCAFTDPPTGCLYQSELLIINVASSDSGEYICSAANKVGNVTYNATLAVHAGK